MPPYQCVVLSWLKPLGERFIMANWLAITIGPLIFSWRVLDKVELAHEVQHVKQWRKEGLMYVPRYLAASDAAEKAGKDRYRDNRFEVEARAAEEKVREQIAGG
jgi:hypothetical protein